MNATKQETVDVIEPKDLMDYLTPRVKLGTRRKTVRQLRAHLRRAKRLYSGGTRAESESLRVVSNETKTKCRQAFLRRQGRKIDLAAILSIVDSDGEPVWSVVCPLAPVSRINGGVHCTPHNLWGRIRPGESRRCGKCKCCEPVQFDPEDITSRVSYGKLKRSIEWAIEWAQPR